VTRPLPAGTGSWRFPIQEAPAGPARSGAPATEGRKLARLPPGLPSKGMNMKEYQRPPTFIAGSAWSRGYLKPLELLRIAAWKTGQGLGSLTINTEDDIEGRTRAAIDCIRPWRGKRIVAHDDLSMWHQWYETARSAIGEKAAGLGLLALHGVGYPMASAILDILDPEVWPVIDRWAIQTVFVGSRTVILGLPASGILQPLTRFTPGIWPLSAPPAGDPPTQSTSWTKRP
jgi:hypothetical protein